MESNTVPDLAPTGIAGLDEIFQGGLTAGKMYLLSGSPGTGKTTISLQFIAEGIRRRERCLYIAVGGAGEDLDTLAKSNGIFLDPEYVRIHTVNISDEILEGPEQRIFHSSESELPVVMKDLLAEVKRLKPTRLVIDSLSDLRLLSDEATTYRRLVLAMRRQLEKGDSTTLITNSSTDSDFHLETICHGVILLEQGVPGYGAVKRRLQVLKQRGRSYRSGWHDFRIISEGLRVFPSLITGKPSQNKKSEFISSADERLDRLFGGGVNRGSSTAIIGASGTGKTTMANQFVVAAAQKGERAAVYLFDESEFSYRERAEGLGLPINQLIDKGLVALREINLADFSTGEFSSMLVHEVEEKNTRVIVIDTLSNYFNAGPEEQKLSIQLHQLLSYLAGKEVTTFLTVEQQGLFGTQAEGRNISYLADSTLLIRFFEFHGEIRRALSVVKKRRGAHETTIRELTLSSKGIMIGEPLVEMQGVLLGVPILD